MRYLVGPKHLVSALPGARGRPLPVAGSRLGPATFSFSLARLLCAAETRSETSMSESVEMLVRGEPGLQSPPSRRGGATAGLRLLNTLMLLRTAVASGGGTVESSPDVQR